MAPAVALWLFFTPPHPTFAPRVGWGRQVGFGWVFAVVLTHVLPWWHCALLTLGAAEAGRRRVGSREEQNEIFQCSFMRVPPFSSQPPPSLLIQLSWLGSFQPAEHGAHLQRQMRARVGLLSS